MRVENILQVISFNCVEYNPKTNVSPLLVLAMGSLTPLGSTD
jgi:hypothetical protein